VNKLTDTDKAQAEEQTQRVMPTQEEGKPDSAETEQAAPQQEVSEAEESASRDELPEGVTDRTREQFEKLKQSNQALKAELDRLSKTEQKNVFGSLAQGPSFGTPQPQQFVDPYTGEVDVQALNKAITDAQQQANAARREARRVKEEAQEKEAYADYPEINPNAKNFDKKLFNATRAILVDSLMNPADYGNKELTLKEAVEIAAGPNTARTRQAEVNARQALEQLGPKEQASLEAEGRSDRRQSAVSYDDLRERSRKGDDDAIVERLKNLK